jgi:hypothetical protein
MATSFGDPGKPGFGLDSRLMAVDETIQPHLKLAFPPRRTIMSATSSSPTRRGVLAGSAAAGAVSPFPAHPAAAADTPPSQPSNKGDSPMGTPEDNPIRPFRIDVREEQIADLRRRVAATRWPDKETVTGPSQGVQLATIQKVARYWQTDHDWRKIEATLNALPQFITEIDGLDIHFIHVRSKHENALPLIVTHGWPGSVIEQLKIIDPLTNPTAHGLSASDAFDLVIPSLPGYGFSGKPTAPGWTPVTIARAWATLMQRLGYTQYVAQGGDWGNAVSEVMALHCRQDCSAFTPIWRPRSQPMFQKLFRLADRRLPASRPMKNVRGTNSMISTDTAWPTPKKCRTGHRRFTESWIRRSASPRGCWITTSAVTA